MSYDQKLYTAEQVAIYYYNESTEEWEYRGGTADNGMIQLEVAHFSTYGVFAEEPTEQEEVQHGDEDEETNNHEENNEHNEDNNEHHEGNDAQNEDNNGHP